MRAFSTDVSGDLAAPLAEAETAERIESGEPSCHMLGLLERLPADLLASHIWAQLPRRDRARLRLAGNGVAQYTASELMTHLKVLVCRTSLLQLTAPGRTLHQRFPRPASLELRLQQPGRRGDGVNGSGSKLVGCGAEFAGGGGAAEEGSGWYGSTAVMSYFLSELGFTPTVTSLSLQGWQELSPRDLHHVAASYPRLARLHLGGLPYNNYLSGPSLEPLARGPHAWLREVVVDTQLVMEPQSALAALAALPRLASLDLTGVPLLPSLDLPLSRLVGLTRLVVTFEHKHAHSEQQLAGLGSLTGLRHLALDFMQLGTGSSLWSGGWLMSQVLSRLTALTCLHLPRAFVDDKAHPAALRALAAFSGLVDLAMGSIILGSETSVAASAAAAATRTRGSAAPSTPREDGGSLSTSGTDNGTCSASGSGEPAPPPLTSLARPWRRLALGAAMPCYVESLLPLLFGYRGGYGSCHAGAGLVSEPSPRVCEAETTAGIPAAATGRAAAAITPSTPRTPVPYAGGSGAAPASAGLELLELSTPCPLQMLQLLLQSGMVRRGGTSCTAASCTATARSAASAANSGCGGGGGVREVRLMLRLAGNWAEVVAAAAAVGPTLTSLALMPTYLYGSGRMMGPQVVSTVASALPLLEHLELYRLNIDPRDIACLTAMPRLRFILVGVAEEARERRGEAYPGSLVRALLAALHADRNNTSGGRCNSAGSDGGRSSTSSGSSTFATGCGGGVGGSIAAAGSSCAGSGRWVNPECGGCPQGGGGGGGTDMLEEKSAGLDEGGGGGSSSSSRAKHPGGCRSRSSSSNGSNSSCSSSSSEVVVCCPELSEEEAARLDEICELEYGMYDLSGGRLRVKRALDGTLPWRLAVGCSMAPPTWRP